MTTIKDVARLAGVSTATVSHVLNNTRFVRDQTRTRVLLAIEELGYRPNIVAKSLRSRKTGTVGLIFCDLKSPFFSDLFQGIETFLGKKGFDLLVTNTGYDIKKEREACELFFSKQVDGIILVPGKDTGEHVKFLVERNFPLVLLDKELRSLRVDVVLVNNFQGSKSAVEYMVSLGHRKIAIISGPQDTSTGRHRLEGYYQAMKESGIPVDSNLVKIADFLEEGGHQAVCELLDTIDPPTAIYACNSPMAMGALRAFQERSVRIGKDVGFVVFDDLPWFRFVDPPLTAVAQPSFTLGETAAQLLTSSILKKHKKPKKIVLDVELQVRRSAWKGGLEYNHKGISIPNIY